MGFAVETRKAAEDSKYGKPGFVSPTTHLFVLQFGECSFLVQRLSQSLDFTFQICRVRPELNW